MSPICRQSEVKRAMILSSEQSSFRPLASVCGFELSFPDDSHHAIVLAAQTPLDFMFIHLGSVAGSLESFLSALRKANPKARLILLCTMVQEPLAMRLSISRDGSLPADEYVIFPSGLNDWIEEHCDARAKVQSAMDASSWSFANLEKLVVEDDLTGLKNRRYLRQFLKQILGYAQTQRFHVTLLLFDIDNFKHYNDQYGHPIGDEVLQQVGKMIKNSCRAHDVVARVGGDEFAVVFWDLPATPHESDGACEERRKRLSEHPRETVFMAQRFRRQLSMANLSILGPSGKGQLTISGGLASFPKDGKDERQLFAMADQAMLHAKCSGKNRIHIVGSPD
jgi:diguanylate cyclase (GGDEF)-like protein